jgi:hypothetical protein
MQPQISSSDEETKVPGKVASVISVSDDEQVNGQILDMSGDEEVKKHDLSSENPNFMVSDQIASV